MSGGERRAFVLAGGRGSRLLPFTAVVPKPLMPLDDTAIIEVLVEQLARAGFARVTVSVGYLGHLIEAVLGDGSRLGTAIDYTRELEPLGTAGALGLLVDVDDADSVLAINGDTLTTIDFADLVARHETSGAAATIALKRRVQQVDFGVVEHDEAGDLVGYTEKPRHEYLVSTGINVLRGSVVRSVAGRGRIDMPDLLVELQGRGERVACHETDAYWLDLGRVEDLQIAADFFREHRDRFLPDA